MEPPTDLGDLTRTQQARDEDWELVREAITQLYWAEERELPEVVKIMGERHNFRATERQYKTRFKKWKLEKNVDSKRMEAIVRIQKRRREDKNKETEFSFRGRPVPQEKIDRWQKRRQSGEEVASPHRLAAPTPSGIEYRTPASLIDSAPSAHSAQGPSSPGGIPDLPPAPSPGGLVFNTLSLPAEGNRPIGSGHAAGQLFGMIHPPGQQKAGAGYPQVERSGSGLLSLPSRDVEMDLFIPVSARDAGALNGPSNRAAQMLLDGDSDPDTLIGYAAQMGENPLWPAMTNNAEVHTHLQADTSIDVNGCMATGDFFYSEGSPIDIPGMEIDTEFMSSGRPCIGDGPRAARRPKQGLANEPPSLSDSDFDSDFDEQPSTANQFGDGNRMFNRFGCSQENTEGGNYESGGGLMHIGPSVDDESGPASDRPQLDASASNPHSSSPDSSSSATHETERLIVQKNIVMGGAQVMDGDIAMDVPRQIERPRAAVSYNRIGRDLRVMGGNVGKEAASDFLKSFFQ